jgi:hypothetical protein
VEQGFAAGLVLPNQDTDRSVPRPHEICFIRERARTWGNPTEWGGAQCANFSSCFWRFFSSSAQERYSPSGVGTEGAAGHTAALVVAPTVALVAAVPSQGEEQATAATGVGVAGSGEAGRDSTVAVPTTAAAVTRMVEGITVDVLLRRQ